MRDQFEQLEIIFADMKLDFEKFSEKGNKSAGARVRKCALQMQKLLKPFRAAVQEAKTA